MPDAKQMEIEEWYERYSDAIFKYILLMVKDYQLAEDLTHETFMKAYTKHQTFKQDASPKTWLFTIARNVTLDDLRKRKPIMLFKDVFNSKKDKQPSPEEIVQIKETSQELVKALGEIKTSYREVIILRKIKGFSIEETSKILNWSESKVKSTLFRAVPALEKQMLKEVFLNEKTV
ncbi:RNA polymerase sigma factor [Heyndrickxia vini]|nr:RNA polymerase sigma factor [Heyndrickxia vini]